MNVWFTLIIVPIVVYYLYDRVQYWMKECELFATFDNTLKEFPGFSFYVEHQAACYGLRHIDSEQGSWQNAFVIGIRLEKQKLEIMSALFEDNKDFIQKNPDIFKCKKDLVYLKTQGWHEMTREDIRQTAGI